MDVEILGPLAVRDDAGREVRLPAGRERALFALLLVNRGEVVSVDRILDVLWGERPPETAPKAVQGYVSHLRRALGGGAERAAGDGPLLTRAPGYALRADAVSLDAARFEELAGDGRRALEHGSAAEAAGLLEEALALWRGPALADFTFDDFAQDEIRRLEELRLAATEDRVEALLRLGRHRELAGELDALVAAHPLRERLRGQAMLARYRSGRQADALALYQDGRRLLASELGLEPGPELQRLQRAILDHDPVLEGPPAQPPPARSPERPPSARARPSRRRLLLGGVLLAAIVAAVVLVTTLAVGGGGGEGPGAGEVLVPSLVALDPATNRVVASIPVGSRPLSVTYGEGSVWVGDGRDGTVSRIDPATRSVVKTIGIGAPAVDLATGVGAVWAATGGFGEVVRIDAGLEAAVERIPLAGGDLAVPRVAAVGAGDGRVWAGAFEGLARIDADSGRVTGRVDLGRAAATGIAVGTDALWATTLRRRAKRVASGSAQVTADFYAGVFVLPVALDEAAAWVAAGDDGLLWKLDPVTGATTLTARAGRGANGIALGFDAVWVASWPDATLVRVDQLNRRRARHDPARWPPRGRSRRRRPRLGRGRPARGADEVDTTRRRRRSGTSISPRTTAGAHPVELRAQRRRHPRVDAPQARCRRCGGVRVRVVPVRSVPSRSPRRRTMKPAS